MRERKNERKAVLTKKTTVLVQRMWAPSNARPAQLSRAIMRKAIQLYWEGNSFRRIEIILKVSHVSVTNLVKRLLQN